MAAAATLAAPPLAAQLAPAPSPPSTTPVRVTVRAWPDAAILAGGAAAALVPVAWPDAFPHATCAPCDPAALWSMDRAAVGPVRGAPGVASNVTLGAEAVLGTIFLASTRRGQGFAPFAEDAVVIAQSLVLTEAATAWAKVLFHRPRPFLYAATATGPVAPDDGQSMPSGHTSIAFAAAAAYASLLHRRGIAADNKLPIAALFAAATATGVLRVAARRHFPTDVAAGAALGLVIGWTVPALHSTRP